MRAFKPIFSRLNFNKMENEVIVFENNFRIRRVWHNEQWYFSVIDVIEILTDSKDARTYWKVLKNREPQLVTICNQFKMAAQDGKQRLTDCANMEGVFRITMSVPSPKAEPLKLWLAEQGKRAIDETENPELLTQRQAELYKAKGYSDEWIMRRMQTIDTRKELTDEWKKRDVKLGQEYSILTATIAKGTFGLNPSEHSNLKGLQRENLRDHMTPLELILTALGEEVTRTMAVKDDAVGFNENLEAAKKGGEAGGRARRNVEEITGEKVVSSENYLKQLKPNVDELPPSV
jgi:DNA-damage-inducible protein D